MLERSPAGCIASIYKVTVCYRTLWRVTSCYHDTMQARVTLHSKKDRERRYAVQWLRRRGIDARPRDHEHPDFVVHHGAETLGIEIVEYHGGGASSRGGSKGRQVEAAWEALQAHADKFRERNPDIDPFEVVLHFSRYRMPPPSSFEDFCNAIAGLIRQSIDLAPGQRRDIPITADIDQLLSSYLLGVQLIKVERTGRNGNGLRF